MGRHTPSTHPNYRIFYPICLKFELIIKVMMEKFIIFIIILTILIDLVKCQLLIDSFPFINFSYFFSSSNSKQNNDNKFVNIIKYKKYDFPARIGIITPDFITKDFGTMNKEGYFG